MARQINWHFLRNTFLKKPYNKLNPALEKSRRFYRRFALNFILYPVTTITNSTKLKPQPWLSYTKQTFSVKNLLHLRCALDLEEFYMYDLYNFYSNTISLNSLHSFSEVFKARYRLWKKFNFFYNIRRSIDKVRSYFSSFYGVTRFSDRKLNTVFWGIRGISTLGYTWFLEFNFAFLLVRLRFASSVKQAQSLAESGLVFINSSPVNSQWSHLNVSDTLSVLTSTSSLLLTRSRIINSLNALKHVRMFIKRYYFSFSLKHSKPKWLLQRAKTLYTAKSSLFKFIEVDYKIGKAYLIPYINPTTYFNYVQLMWANAWNYRITTWKYRT